MEQCKKCEEYRFPSFGGELPECLCKEFEIIDADGEEYEIHAMNERGAALKFAQKSNCEGDYYLMNETVEITVNGKGFAISAEPDIHYSANAK